jgi:predicted nucleic acid-binding protein
LAKVFWDTNLFIYLFEGAGPAAEQTLDLWKRMLDRGDRLYTSALSLGEVLVKPALEKQKELEQRYMVLFQSSRITVIPFDLDAAPHYALVRSDRTIRPPDAIQLACAAAAEVDLFITNDDRLSRKKVSRIKFITSLARAPIA